MCKDHHLIFIPCIGPGYFDTRIRPWNEADFKNRDNGRYYMKECLMQPLN
ncbi:hypothetical protein DRF65_09190 [Chryseobacterium pennae]|uniref:Uncharacterized protein n=1 Tax=Chryseobacterium pennae TaxID=2258962 RepID=A0A3D9CA26_9FLAO|nr:hypothetical protein DRF65_09190 [Chryseobacterium pennae]